MTDNLEQLINDAVVVYCDKSVTKIQQVLLGIFADPLKLLKILV